MQLKEGVRYVTSLTYGGHANQLISIGKLLYLAKMTNRVAILPTLMPVHFDALPESFSTFFDLARFYHLSGIPAIEMGRIKPLAAPQSQKNEDLSCWSIQEAAVGHANLVANSLEMHNIGVNYWPLPPLSRGLGGVDIAFEALKLFDFEWDAREAWVRRVIEEGLPHRSDGTPGTKDRFSPATTPPPDDRVFCVDNSLFIGPVLFPRPYPGKVPYEPRIAGEGVAWEGATQYLHFTRRVEDQVDRALLRLFGITSLARVPPFISVHLRRGDFEEFTGLTALELYSAAVDRVVTALQDRLDHPDDWRGPGKANFRSFHLPAAKYAVLVTTDEPAGTPFMLEVAKKGWVTVDHVKLGTERELGPWWPTVLDAAILARGQGFVGTDKSTFSHIAGLRVKYWHGGIVDVAV